MFVKKLIKWYLVFKIVSGILLIPSELGATENATISISISERTLYLIRNNQRLGIQTYSIAVPKGNYYKLPLMGKLVEVQINPFWMPTESTKAAYLKKKKVELPNVVAPEHPKNAMGKVKFIFDFDQPMELPIRLHGTNDEKSIGKKVSRGCIRMNNADALGMARILLGLSEEEIGKIKKFKRFDTKDKNIRVVIND